MRKLSLTAFRRIAALLFAVVLTAANVDVLRAWTQSWTQYSGEWSCSIGTDSVVTCYWASFTDCNTQSGRCYGSNCNDTGVQSYACNGPTGGPFTGFCKCNAYCPGSNPCGARRNPWTCECEEWSPLLVNLDGRGDVTVSSAADGVPFDWRGDGNRAIVSWPESDGDAWLVLDRNQNGTIDNASEMFGNFTLLASGHRAANGFEALAELDGNRDGRVDGSDPDWGRLLVWKDVQRNGTSEPGELVPVRAAGLVALETDYRQSRRVDANGNEYRYRSLSHHTASPKRRFVYDVYLTTAPTS